MIYDGSVIPALSTPRAYRWTGHRTLTGKPKRGYASHEEALDRDLWHVYRCVECSLWHRAKQHHKDPWPVPFRHEVATTDMIL